MHLRPYHELHNFVLAFDPSVYSEYIVKQLNEMEEEIKSQIPYFDLVYIGSSSKTENV